MKKFVRTSHTYILLQRIVQFDHFILGCILSLDLSRGLWHVALGLNHGDHVLEGRLIPILIHLSLLTCDQLILAAI